MFQIEKFDIDLEQWKIISNMNSGKLESPSSYHDSQFLFQLSLNCYGEKLEKFEKSQYSFAITVSISFRSDRNYFEINVKTFL